ncbi:MAG: OmpA family protein [Verrucomicrobiales bacterium]
MKRTFSVFFLCAIIAAGGLTGCKKAPKAVTTIPGGGSQVNPSVTGNPMFPRTGMTGQPQLDTTGIALNPGINSTPIATPIDPSNGEGASLSERPTGGTENPEILQAQTVYFDFDSSSIRESEFPKLEAVATYLKNNPEARLKIAGNCDERGTEEYNRSLGERRALAALDHLVKQLGIDPARITTVSNGEDMPIDMGNDDAAWAQNRRDDFIVITP